HSVGRIPDQGEHIRVVLTGGAAEIRVEPARPELGCGKAEAHIVVARALRFPAPAGADLNTLGHHAIVRRCVRTLAAVVLQFDRGADAERLDVTLEATDSERRQ